MNRFRGAAVLAGFVALTLGVTACGTPPWAQAGSGSPSPSRSASSSPVPTPVPNDLSAGSTQRTVVAGPVTAAVDYWSTLAMDRWTPGAIKPLNTSMVTTVVPDDGQKVYLQRAAMIATPFAGEEALTPLEAQTDAATVSPGYLVLSPYSYSQTFTVGAVPSEADRVRIELRYDFLVQTTPTSTEYAKQTASDTLTVAIAPE